MEAETEPIPTEPYEAQYEHALGRLVMQGEIDVEAALIALDAYYASFPVDQPANAI